MPTPRKPTHLHEVKGSFKKNPQRKRGSDPTPKGGIGPAPEHLLEDERAAWDELVAIALPGVLGDSDRWCVEMTARLMAKSRRDPETFSAANERNLFTLLSKMGLSPADRARTTPIAAEGDADGWDDL